MKIITNNSRSMAWLRFVQVDDIDDPSSELGLMAGASGGALLLAYTGETGAVDGCVLYAWDASAAAGVSPYVVAGNGGSWIAVAGGFVNGTIRARDDAGAEIVLQRTGGAGQAAVAIGTVDGAIGGLAIGASYSQTEVQALRNACETLADDVRGLSVLVHAIRSSLMVQGLMKGEA
jgi:hypothetical protein